VLLRLSNSNYVDAFSPEKMTNYLTASWTIQMTRMLLLLHPRL
jgi:hypothetical protein